MKRLAIILALSASFPVASFAQNITSGLLAQYTFEGTANDISGNGNNATPGGIFQYPTAGLTGSGYRITGDNALFFSGGGHLVLPTFSAALNSGFTISLWVKDEQIGRSPTGEETYVSFGIVDQPTFGISLLGDSRQILFYLNSGLGGVAKEVARPLNFETELGTWRHLVLTYTPGKMTAYFNGAKIGEQLITVNVFPVTKAALGRHWWSGGGGSSARMSVTYDSVRIYGRALTEADVRQLYLTESTPPSPTPTIATQPTAQTVIERQSTTFKVQAASATPLLFQWHKNGVAISGALEATYTIPTVAVGDAGTYSVAVTNAVGTTISSGAVLTVVNGNPGRFANVSTLGSGGFTMGFVVDGDTPKTVLVRGVGPALRAFGITNPAPTVTLTLYSGSSLMGSNTGWSGAPNATQIAAFAGAFPLAVGSGDSAILVRLNPGSYTAQVTATGPVLVEAYDVP